VSAPDDGGPVFPSQWTNETEGNATAPDGQLVPPGGTVPLIGMSLRDYLAAQSISGLFAWDAAVNVPRSAKPAFAELHGAKRVAELAYEIADAMLEARRK
jgi:hypothetical protein